MAIQNYRSSTPGNVPDPNDMLEGQIAINMRDRILYYKDDLGNILSFGGRLVADGLILGTGFVPDITKSDVAVPTTVSYGNQLERNSLFKFQHPTRSGSWFSLDTSNNLTGNQVANFDYKEFSGTTLIHQDTSSPTGVLAHSSFLGYAYRDTDTSFMFTVATVNASTTDISIFYVDFSAANPVLSLSNTVSAPVGTNNNVQANINRGYCDFNVAGSDQNTLYVWLPTDTTGSAHYRVELDITNLSSIVYNVTTTDKVGPSDSNERILYRNDNLDAAYTGAYATNIGTTTYIVYTDSKEYIASLSEFGAATIDSSYDETYFMPWGLNDIRIYQPNTLTGENIQFGQVGYSREELNKFTTDLATSLGGFQ